MDKPNASLFTSRPQNRMKPPKAITNAPNPFVDSLGFLINNKNKK